MADSYDDEIQAMLDERRKRSERRKAARKQELMRKILFAAAVVAVILLIIAIAFGIKGCVASHRAKTKKPAPVATTAVAESETVPVQTVEETTTRKPGDLSGLKMYTTAVLNFRTEPSQDADFIEHIPKGARVKVISNSDGWCRVRYNGHKGYVKQEYLSETKPE